MLCPKNFAQKIGFASIAELLQGLCITQEASDLAGKMHPIDNFDKLLLFLNQTAEFKRVLDLEKPFPSQDYYPMGEELARLRVQGSYITLQGLQRFRASYKTLCEIKAYFAQLDAEIYPHLLEFSAFLETDESILPETNRILTQTGEIRDNASENLLRIRSLIRRKSSQTQTYIGRYMSTAKQQGWVEENAEVTVRNERLVIPVGAAYKKSMRGFIHDVSATGQTVFMEPEEIFNLNNEIVELKNEERLEIISILKHFSDFLRPKTDNLRQAYRFLTAVDFLRAKALLAQMLQGCLPVLRNEPCLNWQKALHPLLYLSLKKQGEPQKIVPLNITLAEGERIVIISGPNAGGKSVCLKTVGLLQYMLQCGLLIPVSEDSQAGFFKNIFVDIGDEQSIENDLSTYSSHLTNMKFWVEHANASTLFLCDELGGGTEPNVGGAIAEALIETLLRKGAYGIVTTHYTNLKLMAKRHPGIVNGAMLFDQDALRPLYVFQKGLPGSSFAFEIARKIGLPESLLASASKKAGRQQMHFEQELQQIEVQKHEMSRKQQQIALADTLLSETVAKYTALLAELEQNKSDLMRRAKEEAKALVKNANAQIERVIREIREAQAEKETTARLRRELRQQVEEENLENTPSVAEKPRKQTEKTVRSPKKPEAAPLPLQEGSFVKMDGTGSIGQIEKIKGGAARVNFDFMHMQVPLSRLVALSRAESEQYVRNLPKAQASVQGINSGGANFKPYADIRGMRADEALSAVSKLLDEALLYGHKHVEILHGKGNGVLRQLTRATAAKNPHVASYADQSEEFGGTGITRIELA